jgi:hypothetical protein
MAIAVVYNQLISLLNNMFMLRLAVFEQIFLTSLLSNSIWMAVLVMVFW